MNITVTEQMKRAAVLSAVSAGRTPKEIAMQERRLTKAEKLLNKVKHPEKDNLLKFFSDEKNFDQDQKVNRRNDRWRRPRGP